ncbi:MAG: tyrosine--tRNA ligase [Candidatus Pacebacteria bacterium]|nr:tyrosine--tRNA ligase [Candidatus Paceibacterota bacterium]
MIKGDKMDKINEVLTRRVATIYPSKKSLEKVLRSGKKIRLYLGIDPTAVNLHLGHLIPLRILEAFGRLGHEAIFLFGTGTVLVGDPSERESGRKLITEAEVKKNVQTWKDQIRPVIDLKYIKFRSNADWLTKLTLKDIIKIGSKISAVQLFKRDSFTRRIRAGDTVWYHETMYPLLQGYDSVVMDVDLEIGGTDQMFNMLIGRELQKKFRDKEKYVMTMKMLSGSDGKTMSKTSGNTINLLASPQDKFGQAMRIIDEMIFEYFKLVTDLPLTEIKQLEKNLQSGQVQPMNLKKRLAFEIVKMYHGEKAAAAALKEFEQVFQKNKNPKKMPIFKTSQARWGIIDFLITSKLAPSRSEAKRLIKQNAVEIESKKITNPNLKLRIDNNQVVRVGKRRFKKIKIIQNP